MTSKTTLKTVTTRLVLAESLHVEFRKLALDLRISPSAAFHEAVVLLMRYHDRGAGLREPLPAISGRSPNKRHR